MTYDELVALNNERDLYFRHEENGAVNVVFVPRDWAREFGPGNTPDVGGDPYDDEPGAYGYGATRLVSNDPEIATLWHALSTLGEEITEDEARRLHPNLFQHLAAIDAGSV